MISQTAAQGTENNTSADNNTFETTTVEPEMFFGNDFSIIKNTSNEATANVLKTTLTQYIHHVHASKLVDKITVEGDTIEEIQEKLALLMLQKTNEARTPQDITLSSATIEDILKHKSEELGAFLFEVLAEVAEQVKSTGKVKGVRNKSGLPRVKPDLFLYAVQVEGVNASKPFLVLQTGAFTIEMRELADKIAANGNNAEFEKKNPKGQTTWDKVSILEKFGTKVEISSDEIYEKFDGKVKNITPEKLGDKMPKLTTKKVSK